MTFAVALAIGASFWAHRGVDIPCHPQPVIKTEQQMPEVSRLPSEMATRTDTCRIWLSPAAIEFKHNEPAYFCGEVVHELGHLAGLGHTDSDGTGLMDAQHALGTTDWIPFECRRAARPARRPAARSLACRDTHPTARRACRRRS